MAQIYGMDKYDQAAMQEHSRIGGEIEHHTFEPTQVNSYQLQESDGRGSHTGDGGRPANFMGLFGRRTTRKLQQQEEDIINVAWASFRESDDQFSAFDFDKNKNDKSGYITTASLTKAFEAIDAKGEVQQLIDDIDENGDGQVDWFEFRSIMERKFLGEDGDSSFVHSFRMLDVDKDGWIPLVELRQVLMRQGQAPLSEQEVDELLMFADTDGDGLINYEDFLRRLDRNFAPDYDRASLIEKSLAGKDGKAVPKAKAGSKSSGNYA